MGPLTGIFKDTDIYSSASGCGQLPMSLTSVKLFLYDYDGTVFSSTSLPSDTTWQASSGAFDSGSLTVTVEKYHKPDPGTTWRATLRGTISYFKPHSLNANPPNANPPDEDFDGIADDKDKCLNTPPQCGVVTVNADGCLDGNYFFSP